MLLRGTLTGDIPKVLCWLYQFCFEVIINKIDLWKGIKYGAFSTKASHAKDW